MYWSKHVNMCKRIHVSVLTYKHVNINMYTPYPPFGFGRELGNIWCEHMYLSKHVNMCKRIHVSILTYKHVSINMYTPYINTWVYKQVCTPTPPFGLESISTAISSRICTRIITGISTRSRCRICTRIITEISTRIRCRICTRIITGIRTRIRCRICTWITTHRMASRNCCWWDHNGD